MIEHIRDLIAHALGVLKLKGMLPADATPTYVIERTRHREYGDYACNIALVLAKTAARKPREIAEALIQTLPKSEDIAKIDIAGPGFINFFLSASAYQNEVRNILVQAENYGRNNSGGKRKLQIEFVSANPTGPLHVGHGRGAAVGDCLARLLAATGWDVSREFYYNDAGQQINNLALSVQARARGIEPEQRDWPEGGYRGNYIHEVARAYLACEAIDADGQHVVARGDVEDLNAIQHFAVASLRREQNLDLEAFGVKFDVYYLESSLYKEGKIEQTVQQLIASGYTYEQDGALYLRTTDFGDDKDRVMRKSDGSYTYFLPDIAYHVTKWQRGFGRVINEQGADHHSTITRVRAGLQALDMQIPKDWPDYVLHQMVTVMRGGEEVKLSKRAGSYVTLRDLIDEVGCDASRYFLLARKADSQLVFDIDLARSQSNDNPVYYIQYAHARVCSLQRQLGERDLSWNFDNGLAQLHLLTSSYEQALMVELSRYPEILDAAARNLEPHMLAQYLRDLATAFHAYYNAEAILVTDHALRDARMNLCVAVKQVLRNGLDLLGVSAPEKM